jgi:hypothetical protein
MTSLLVFELFKEQALFDYLPQSDSNFSLFCDGESDRAFPRRCILFLNRVY